MHHNYGLDKLVGEEELKSGTIKNVTLVNVRDCMNKITLNSITDRLLIVLGNNEEKAEYYAVQLVTAIVNSLVNRRDEADITPMFKNYYVSPTAGEDECKESHQKLIRALIGWLFEIVGETNNEMKVKLTRFK